MNIVRAKPGKEKTGAVRTRTFFSETLDLAHINVQFQEGGVLGPRTFLMSSKTLRTKR